MVYIAEFTQIIVLSLKGLQINEALAALNVFHVGDPVVNEYVGDTTKLVGKYDNHPNFKPLQESHYSVNMGYQVEIRIGVTPEGRLEIIK